MLFPFYVLLANDGNVIEKDQMLSLKSENFP